MSCSEYHLSGVLTAVALNRGIQLQVLFDRNIGPQDIELRADAQVLADAPHLIADGHPVDDCLPRSGCYHA